MSAKPLSPVSCIYCAILCHSELSQVKSNRVSGMPYGNGVPMDTKVGPSRQHSPGFDAGDEIIPNFSTRLDNGGSECEYFYYLSKSMHRSFCLGLLCSPCHFLPAQCPSSSIDDPHAFHFTLLTTSLPFTLIPPPFLFSLLTRLCLLLNPSYVRYPLKVIEFSPPTH